jgi:hypothetical protein
MSWLAEAVHCTCAGPASEAHLPCVRLPLASRLQLVHVCCRPAAHVLVDDILGRTAQLGALFCIKVLCHLDTLPWSIGGGLVAVAAACGCFCCLVCGAERHSERQQQQQEDSCVFWGWSTADCEECMASRCRTWCKPGVHAATQPSPDPQDRAVRPGVVRCAAVVVPEQALLLL